MSTKSNSNFGTPVCGNDYNRSCSNKHTLAPTAVIDKHTHTQNNKQSQNINKLSLRTHLSHTHTVESVAHLNSLITRSLLTRSLGTLSASLRVHVVVASASRPDACALVSPHDAPARHPGDDCHFSAKWFPGPGRVAGLRRGGHLGRLSLFLSGECALPHLPSLSPYSPVKCRTSGRAASAHGILPCGRACKFSPSRHTV